MLIHDNFETSCKAFLNKFAGSDDEMYGGWSWREHAYLPRLGYLVRKSYAQASASALGDADQDLEIIEDDDEADAATAASPPGGSPPLEVWQYIVYSATFQVPTFYFSVHTRSGSPLSLDDILKSSVFRREAFPNAQKTLFALQTPGSSFPLLSQGEHPTLGTPCWFLHPCETAMALAELIEADGSGNACPAREVELWLLLVGNVVNLRGS